MVSDRLSQEPLMTFDWTGSDTVSEAIVSAVSDCSEADPTTFAPLYETIDPDALNSLFLSAAKSVTPPTGSIQFQYEDYIVVIKEHGLGYLFDQADDQQVGGVTANTQRSHAGVRE